MLRDFDAGKTHQILDFQLLDENGCLKWVRSNNTRTKRLTAAILFSLTLSAIAPAKPTQFIDQLVHSSMTICLHRCLRDSVALFIPNSPFL